MNPLELVNINCRRFRASELLWKEDSGGGGGAQIVQLHKRTQGDLQVTFTYT